MSSPVRLAAFVAIAICNCAASAQEKEGLKATRAAFAAAAIALEKFAYDDVLVGRHADPDFAGEPWIAAFVALRARGDADAALTALLADEDAKVRTLAMLVLFDRDPVRHLPEFWAMRGDAAVTFAQPEMSRGRPMVQKLAPITVGAVAMQCVGVLVQPADRFEEYWAARKDRAQCAGWLAVELMRARAGRIQAPPSAAAAIAAVKAKVLALPTPERELLLLTYCGGAPEPAFATDAERLTAARALSEDAILALFDGKVNSDDPDLRAIASPLGDRRGMEAIAPGQALPTFRGLGGAWLMQFVMQHAREIFAPSSAKKLVELGARLAAAGLGIAVEAEWVAAAASLQPEHAEQWVSAVYERAVGPGDYGVRMRLLRTLCESGDDAARLWIAEQFWKHANAANGSLANTDFEVWLRLAGAAKDQNPFVPRPKGWESLRDRVHAQVRAIVARPEFATCDALTLMAIGRVVGVWQDPQLLGEDELQKLVQEPALSPEQLDAWRTRIRTMTKEGGR